jgi:hypothetical protein
MGDPERLLGPTSGSDELERELLGSLRDVSPPPGAKGRAWEGVAVQVAAVTAASAGAAAAEAATSAATAKTTALGVAAKALTAKVVIGVALGGSTLAAGGYWATHRRAETPAVSVASDRPIPQPIAEPPAAIAAPDPLAAPDRPSRPIDEPKQRSLLAIESRMLTDARAELRGGDPRAAMATLDRMQARFPKGVLMQEREVLTIQVLAALGDGAAASRKAREFLKAYPSSPHAPQLRRYAGEP